MFRCILALALSMVALSARAEELVLLRAQCVDPEAERIVMRSLWIRDGLVAATASPDGEDLPGDAGLAERLDLQGRFLLPGLFDGRVHGGTLRSPGHRDQVGSVGTARLLLRAGVTRYVESFLGASALAARGAWNTETDAARPLVGGPVVTVPRGVASEFPEARRVTDAEDLRSWIAALGEAPSDERPDVLTAVFDRGRGLPTLTPELLRQLLLDASAAGLPVAVQVGTWRDVQDALDAGATWLVQIPAGAMPPSVRDVVAAARPYWSPALAVGQDFASLASEPGLREDPVLRRFLPEPMIEDYAQVRVPQGRLTQAARERDTRLASVAGLEALGVRWIAGSEAGAVGTAFGYTLVRELQSMDRAGVPPWTVLASATSTPAGLLGRGPGFAVGDVADFVLLPESPVRDLGVLHRLEAVMLAGRWVDLQALEDAVGHELEEDLPESPLPGDNRLSLIAIVVAGFVVLLVLRGAVKRAAARAREDV